MIAKNNMSTLVFTGIYTDKLSVKIKTPPGGEFLDFKIPIDKTAQTYFLFGKTKGLLEFPRCFC
jgi:hypothetical protein